jgi:hypothetical protein
MNHKQITAKPVQGIFAGAFRFFTQSLLAAILWAVISTAVIIFFLDRVCIGPLSSYATLPGREWLLLVFFVIRWLGDTLKTFFPWPFVVLILSLYFTQSSVAFSSLKKFFQLFKGVKHPILKLRCLKKLDRNYNRTLMRSLILSETIVKK